MKMCLKHLRRRVALALALSVLSGALAAENGMQVGVYVAVTDLIKSMKFYEAVLQTRPYVQTQSFVGFAINGGRFGIMRASAYAFPMTRGNSAIPNLRVADIDAEYRRIKALQPSMIQDHITNQGTMRLFEFADPDGNVIEIFALPN